MSGGGGLLEGLHMRSLLTAGVLSSEHGVHASRGGLRALAIQPFPTGEGPAPRTLEDLMSRLLTEDRRISVPRVGAGRDIAYLPGSTRPGNGRLRLVGADSVTYVQQVGRATENTIDGGIDGGTGGDGVSQEDARVMLVGSAAGSAVATEIAATIRPDRFVVDQVVTAGAPSAQVPLLPEPTRMLSLEDRADPVALLGSLINASVTNRLTIVFEGAGDGAQVYVTRGPGRRQRCAPAAARGDPAHPGPGFLAG